MTDFHALDLSGDRAALHRWDGCGWQPVGVACCDGATGARALADLLSPVAGQPVAVALPPTQVRTDEIDAPGGVSMPADSRVDWVARSDGGWLRFALPLAAMAEIERFLRALGVQPGGCMADAGDGLPPAWFGALESAAPDGRAADRPACLGLAGPAPETPAAAARRRAQDAARQNPAHLTPLPDMPTEAPPADTARPHGARQVRLPGLGLPRGGWRGAAMGALLAGLVAAGWWLPGGGPGPGPAADAPATGLLAGVPSPADAPARTATAPGGAAPLRAQAAAPPFAADDAPPAAPRPARQASLSAMDAPPGMIPAATFYTPPFRLADHALDDAAMLTIPGLDPVFRTDALALANAPVPDPEPAARRSLAPAGAPDHLYVVDARGLIRPSAAGRLSPDGFTVVAGPPPAAVRPRPARSAADLPVRVMRRSELGADDPLRALLPRARPAGLAERHERDRLGGRTATELAGFVPLRRPASAQERAGDASSAAAPRSPLALAAAPRPVIRDSDAVARARTAAAAKPDGPVIAAADVARAPAPTPVATSERATRRVGLDLSQINLLGTFGTRDDRRALVRLPSGRVVNLAVGDRMDGGRVQSIGNGRLGYVKSGRTVTLRMPRG